MCERCFATYVDNSILFFDFLVGFEGEEIRALVPASEIDRNRGRSPDGAHPPDLAGDSAFGTRERPSARPGTDPYRRDASVAPLPRERPGRWAVHVFGTQLSQACKQPAATVCEALGANRHRSDSSTHTVDTSRPMRRSVARRADSSSQSSSVVMSADSPCAISMSFELFSVHAVRSVTASITSRPLG